MRISFKLLLPFILIVILFFLFFTSIPPRKEDLCLTLNGEVRSICESCREKYTNISLLKCVAKGVVHFDTSLAKEICSRIEKEDEQKLCFAEALREIDLTAALHHCDLIEDVGIKAFCRALTFRDMNETSKGEKECEVFLFLNNGDAYHQCMALLLRDKSYCEKITFTELKDSCISSLT